jgi:hypothetical protein
MIARITDAWTAAPTPWRKRAAISAPGAGAPAQDRGGREERDAREEHALAAEQVAEPAREQQQAAEGDQERVDDPGQPGLGEVELALDRGQGDVHDRGVEHDHQLGHADDDEGQPAPALTGELERCGDEAHALSIEGDGW